MMVREERLRTSIGQAAWQFYQDWFRYQRKRVPDDRAFLKSQYFESFIRFAEFVRNTSLPSPDIFVKLMIEKNYTPTMWLIDSVYAQYMEHLELRASPQVHAEITVETLMAIADAAECDVSEVFDVMTGSEVIELVRQRKLSPWVLLLSDKFKEFLINLHKKNREQYIVLESLIRYQHWMKRFEKRPDDVRYMKKIVAELGL